MNQVAQGVRVLTVVRQGNGSDRRREEHEIRSRLIGGEIFAADAAFNRKVVLLCVARHALTRLSFFSHTVFVPRCVILPGANYPNTVIASHMGDQQKHGPRLEHPSPR